MHSALASLAAALALTLGTPGTARAQDFPTHSIRMIVPYPAGGSVDVLGRAVADKLTVSLGQPVIPDNRIGANGSIAHQMVATAPPDGYTIGMSGTSPLVLAPHQIKDLPYDTNKDFAFLACPGTTPFVLDVHPSLPVKTVQELVAYAKANPGKLNFGSAGMGNSAHLSAELFKRTTGIDMVHVPYKGNALAMNDLVAGQIQVLFDPVQTSIPQIKAGKVRPLAVTGRTRFTELPDVPTVAESGYPSYEFVVWYAFVAPARTPAPIVARLNREIVKVVNTDDMRERLRTMGNTAKAGTPEEFTQTVSQYVERWTAVINRLGIAR